MAASSRGVVKSSDSDNREGPSWVDVIGQGIPVRRAFHNLLTALVTFHGLARKPKYQPFFDMMAVVAEIWLTRILEPRPSKGLEEGLATLSSSITQLLDSIERVKIGKRSDLYSTAHRVCGAKLEAAKSAMTTALGEFKRERTGAAAAAAISDNGMILASRTPSMTQIPTEDEAKDLIDSLRTPMAIQTGCCVVPHRMFARFLVPSLVASGLMIFAAGAAAEAGVHETPADYWTSRLAVPVSFAAIALFILLIVYCKLPPPITYTAQEDDVGEGTGRAGLLSGAAAGDSHYGATARSRDAVASSRKPLLAGASKDDAAAEDEEAGAAAASGSGGEYRRLGR